MFTNLGNIFSVKPRQAESADTRMHIRRQEPDQERNKKKRKKPEDELFQEGNSMTMSIEALRMFLENFLASHSPKNAMNQMANPAAQTQAPENTPEQAAQEKPKNSQAAQAAQAYQTSMRASQPTSMLSDISDGEDIPSFKLEANEIRAIHALLKDLKDLSAKKLETITIHHADSFLESLSKAVEKAKTSVN